MLRIDTTVVVAGVIDGVANTKRAQVCFVRETMRPDLAPLSGGESHVKESIAVCVGRAGPLPTAFIEGDELGTEPLIVCGTRTPGHGFDHTTVYTTFIGEQLLAALALEPTS